MKKFVTFFQLQKGFKLKSQGQSMRPLLLPNDILYFKKVAFSRIRTNDLVMINKGKNFFTHRVIYKTNKCSLTKGDNSPKSDGKIYPKQILEKVYLHYIFYLHIIRPIVRPILD